MAQNAAVLQAVEQLGYRVTVGDVAATAGLPLAVAQQGVLALASDVQAHLQVSEAGEIAYQFPRNARVVLLGKYWRLRLQETWSRIWRVLFYLIRVSFGILLILSLLLIVFAIIALTVAAQASNQGNDREERQGYGGGGLIFMPRFWFGPDFFYLFDFNYGRNRRRQQLRRDSRGENQLNFLEAIFSFLFGDGNPNADLEERRWQTIAAVIRNQRGAVVAEQIAPYLDNLGEGWSRENEDYMLPVLSRFNGLPEVSPDGQLVYHFPELQVTAADYKSAAVPEFLQELPRRFSQASAGQIMIAVGLGGANLVGALALGSLLRDQVLVAELGGLVAFASSIYWLLLGYGAAFLSIPLVRYFWVQWQNRQIDQRNYQRQERAIALDSTEPALQQKLAFARQFAAQTVVTQENLAYTTERDLVEQEAENPDKIDQEWQRRLREYNS